MKLDVRSLGTTMIDAARNATPDRWSAMRALGEPELRRLAQSIARVQQRYAAGEIDRKRATQLIVMHRDTTISVMKTVEGFGLKTARDAVDAAANAAGAIVNRLVGFRLIATKGE